MSCQTELLACDVILKDEHEKLKDDFEILKNDFERLKKEHHKLLLKSAEEKAKEVELQLSRPTFDEDAFKDNDAKVRFFTGLTNWEVLYKLFQFVREHLIGHSSLTPFQQLMLTLMRLRLASSGIELGYHFGIHPSTVCRIFSDVMEML